ncbi:MAG: hypothetical protein AVDCRST_MAG59-5349, partial [uncultured Thermomicrobiales bacterium]
GRPAGYRKEVAARRADVCRSGLGNRQAPPAGPPSGRCPGRGWSRRAGTGCRACRGAGCRTVLVRDRGRPDRGAVQRPDRRGADAEPV